MQEIHTGSISKPNWSEPLNQLHHGQRGDHGAHASNCAGAQSLV